jgi:cellulose synthase/poly-beta-1,6-N-acetylglucosamine synthase-like glycosyltransferase
VNGPRVLDVDLRDEASPVPAAFDDVVALLWWGHRVLGEVTLTSECGDWAHVRAGLLSEWRPVLDALALVPVHSGEPHVRSADVTVVVTRTRPGDLAACLEVLARLDPAPAEVIVVDSDPTTRVASEAVGGRDVRVVRAPTGGVSAARNAGWRAARTPVVAFTDDDARPHRNWVGALADGFGDAAVVCVTGLVLAAELVTPAQRLFEASARVRRDFSPRLFASPAPGADTSRLGVGVNAAFRRDALERIGGFDVCLGAGSATKGAEDLDAFLRVMSLGGVLAYRPDAVVRHIHPRDLPSLLQRYSANGTAYSALLRKHRLSGGAAVVAARDERLRWHRDRHLRGLLGAVRRRDPRRVIELIAELTGSSRGAAALATEQAGSAR